jgi:hypothetical protein
VIHLIILDEVGGWPAIAKNGHSRPHVPVERFPPADVDLAGWEPVSQRDPLGLTRDQRIRSDSGEDLPDLHTLVMDLLERMRDNMSRIDSLPAGTMIDTGCPCGPHPVEMYR